MVRHMAKKGARVRSWFMVYGSWFLAPSQERSVGPCLEKKQLLDAAGKGFQIFRQAKKSRNPQKHILLVFNLTIQLILSMVQGWESVW